MQRMSAEIPKINLKRQGKYKYTTPPWKDVYRKVWTCSLCDYLDSIKCRIIA